jgi:hypothetical protein
MIHLSLAGFTPEECYELMLIGLNAQKAKIDSEIEGLRLHLYPKSRPSTEHREYIETRKKAAPPKRVMSKEGPARIIAAQKKRWASQRAKKAPAAKKLPVKKQAAKK